MHSHLQAAHTSALGSETHLLRCPIDEAYVQKEKKTITKTLAELVTTWGYCILVKINHMLQYAIADRLVFVGISVLAGTDTGCLILGVVEGL